jgi:hypothetical protein
MAAASSSQVQYWPRVSARRQCPSSGTRLGDDLERVVGGHEVAIVEPGSPRR